MKYITILIASFLITSCDIEKPSENDYDSFVCTEFPEKRVYFPEEKITFTFNMNLNHSSSKGFSAKETETNEELSTEIFENTVSVMPPLPQESSVSVIMNSALKSFDNKPLMTGDGFSENKEVIEMEFFTGKKLPEMQEFFPSDTQSASVIVKFDGLVDIKTNNITPKPLETIKIEEGQAFAIIYEKPVQKIQIVEAVSTERNVIIENFEINLTSKKPENKELSVDYSFTDTSITVNIKDDSSVAAKVNKSYNICEKQCSITLNDLKPETNYTIKTLVYTTTGEKSKSASISTSEEKPHIVISEVMHSPSLEPEKNWEFVEIFNSGNLDFDLSSCFIDDKNDGKGIDPLISKNLDKEPILKPGELAVITGNEAAFSDVLGNSLWLVVDDTTIADAGLTSTESIQIICNRNDSLIIEATVNSSNFKTEKGYSFNIDINGKMCQSLLQGGSPGKYVSCD